MEAALKNSKIGIAADLWSDKFTNIHYLGMVAHYILRNQKTYKITLVTRELKLQAADEPKTAELIKQQVADALVQFNLNEKNEQIVFITDRGKNMANAVKQDFVRRSCIDHFINNIIEHCSKKVENTRINVIKVVKYLKCTGKCREMSGHINSFVKTRWNTLFDLFDSFLTVYDEVRMKISDKRPDIISRFNRINRQTLADVRDFLELFKTLTIELESDTVVTSVKLLPAYEMLLDHVKHKAGDSTIVKGMKQIAASYIAGNKHEVIPSEFH